MSQQKLNIGGDENDVNYRYKMVPLQTKVEGRGNGIKTVLVNVTDVAKDLHTEPQYVTRYFAAEVGAVSQWDKQRNAGIVHGVHQSKDLQSILKKFISEFILCPKCKLPELQTKVDPNKSALWHRCSGCGWKGKNESTHKVKTYMINNPPPSKKKASENDESSKVIKTKPAVSKPKTKIQASQADDKEANVNEGQLGGADDEIWSVEVDDDAVNERWNNEMSKFPNKRDNSRPDNFKDEKENERNQNDNTRQDSPTKPSQESAYEQQYIEEGPSSVLRQFVNDMQHHSDENRDVVTILDEIKRLSLARKLDNDKTMKVVFEGLCQMDNHEKFNASLKKYAKVMKQFTKTPKDCEIFFARLEEIIARRNKNLLSRTYAILNRLYDEEIVTEEQILQWFHNSENSIIEKEECSQIRKSAEPFIKWLESANEDDSGEDVE